MREKVCKASVLFHCSRLYVFKDALYSYSERKSKPHGVIFSFLKVESVSFYEIDSEKEST